MPILFDLSIDEFFSDTPNTKIFFDSKKNPHKVEVYDSSTSKRCWRDHHPFTLVEDEIHEQHAKGGYPLPVDRSKGIALFCSYECMLGYASDETRPLLRSSQSLVLEMFMKDYPDVDPLTLKAAPPFEVLKEYGGVLTIEEFRKNFHRPKKSNIFIILTQAMNVGE